MAAVGSHFEAWQIGAIIMLHNWHKSVLGMEYNWNNWPGQACSIRTLSHSTLCVLQNIMTFRRFFWGEATKCSARRHRLRCDTANTKKQCRQARKHKQSNHTTLLMIMAEETYTFPVPFICHKRATAHQNYYRPWPITLRWPPGRLVFISETRNRNCTPSKLVVGWDFHANFVSGIIV